MGKSAPWQTLLLRKNDKPGGVFVPCVANVATIFSHDPEWRGVLAFDEFVGDIVSLKEPPWPEDLAPDKIVIGSWTDMDTLRASTWLARKYNLDARTSTVGEGLRVAATRTCQHPLRDALTSVKWDRKPRIDTFLSRLAGAEDTPYTRAVSKNFFIGAVARVLCPGAKVDSMLIFEGAQGIGKSSLVCALAGEPWYLETTIEMGTKDSYQILRRKWIVELGELDALTRTEVSRVKQFLSQRVDTYRPSYGRGTVDFPRQCVFIGTVNPNGGGYLKDETGARRFQPVCLGKVDLVRVHKERPQLWAEAVFRYRKCERWHLDDPRLIAAAKSEAEDRRQRHPWETPVAEWLASQKADTQAKGVTTHDILTTCLDIPIDRQGRGDEMQAAAILRACGWTDVCRDYTTAGRPRRYRLPATPRAALNGVLSHTFPRREASYTA